MSLTDYERAKQLLKQVRRSSTFVGPVSEAQIAIAQDRLLVDFPKIYRQFLLEYGAGGVGFFEIYGITEQEDGSVGYPDVVQFTIEGRKKWGLHHSLIPIFELGDGEVYCLDLRNPINGEARIVGFTPGYSSPEQKLEVVAEDFGSLLLELVQIELKLEA